MEQDRIRVLAIPGSLRRASRNRGLLWAASDVAPSFIEVELFDLHNVPLYNGDVESKGIPSAVAAFQQAIRTADALLISTPEYNGAVPGVLKNALDWASRPHRDSALLLKPVAVVGASPGKTRSANAQAQVRAVLEATGSLVLPEPRLAIAGTAGEFDGDGSVVDAELRSEVAKLVEALAAWAVLSRQHIAA
ncbi:MAG: NAD(P)H-dependent oxidoreductase [Chloroflexota bacterium]|nr:NAD(P)H-dependent oxidoreductase [Chloroflexota bacterium]